MLFRTNDYFGQIIQVQISTLKFKIFKVFFSIIIKKTLYLQNLKNDYYFFKSIISYLNDCSP
jgi:hypothetical protein